MKSYYSIQVDGETLVGLFDTVDLARQFCRENFKNHWNKVEIYKGDIFVEVFRFYYVISVIDTFHKKERYVVNDTGALSFSKAEGIRLSKGLVPNFVADCLINFPNWEIRINSI